MMTRPTRFLEIAQLLAFSLSGLATSQLQAQGSNQGAQISGLEEVIVTARKREERLIDTPVSITAFSGADLKARQIDSVDQIAQATPGLVFQRDAGSFNNASRIFIRGVGQVDFVPTQQPGVGLYVDGVYIAPSAGSLLDMLDIEAVEVLRGPQGTLFGRNTIGGAVQVNTVKPSKDFSADAEALVGRFDRWRVMGQVNIPFTDTFYGKFSGLFQEKEGYIDAPNIPNGEGFGGDDVEAARVALRWLPSDALTLDLSGEYSKQQSNGRPIVQGSPARNRAINPATGLPTGALTLVGQYNSLVAPNVPGRAPSTDANFLGPETYTSLATLAGEESEVKGLNLTAQWDVSDNLTFKSLTSYRTADSIVAADNDTGAQEIALNTVTNDGEYWSQEFQLSGVAFAERLNWLAGLFYYREKVTNLAVTGVPTLSFVSGSKVDNQSAAVFGQATYDFTDKLSLTLGGRYTDERLDSIVDDDLQYLTTILCAPAFGGPILRVPSTIAACAAQGAGFAGYAPVPAPPNPLAFKFVANGVSESDQTKFEPYLNLAYHFTDDLMAYVSYSEGFKGGGFTQRIQPGGSIRTFEPEFAKVYEIGAKWSGERLRVNGALFYNDYTDLQVQTLVIVGGTIENAADAVIQGGELEVEAAVTERLTLSGGVAYLDDEYKNVDPLASFSANNGIPFVKDWQVNGAASYRLPLPTGELIARLDYFYSSDYFVEAQNLPELFIDSYYLLNAGVTYLHGTKRWEVGVQGRNITDEYYTTSGGGGLNVNGFTQLIVGPPAEWSMRFAYHF